MSNHSKHTMTHGDAILTRPRERYKASYIDAVYEYIGEKQTVNWHPEILRTRFDEYLKVAQQMETDPLPGMVPSSLFWLVADGKGYIGDVDVRHYLIHSLKRYGGHIGYKIRPSCRRRGYGTLICRLGMEQARLLGVGDPALAATIAEAVRLLDIGRALVVHGHSGVDEVSLTGPTHVLDVRDGVVTEYDITPADFGLPTVDPAELETHDAQTVAGATRLLLADQHAGARRDVVLANASAALVAAGIASDWRDGVTRAAGAIADGSALACLNRLVEVSNRSDGA